MYKLAFLPSVGSQVELDGLIARCAWYLFPYHDQISTIHIQANETLTVRNSVPEIFNPKISDRIEALLPKIRLETTPEKSSVRLLEKVGPVDAIFLWKANIDDGELRESDQFKQLKLRGRVFDVDPNAIRMEGSFYLWAGLNLFGNKNELTQENHERFKRFLSQFESVERTYVFGTGPSLSEFALSHDFSDGVCLAANSMVKNKQVLDRLKPVAIVAADPIFHAGCSRYASAFHNDLIEALDRYDAYFITALRDYNISLSYLPERLHERVIGIPFLAQDAYNIELADNFHVNPLPNVLTLLLLPVASAISEKIMIAGCDGRPRDENGYFWSHDKAVQFNDEMDNIKQVHPAFFEIDYEDYYETHCNDLERAINTLEAAKHHVINLTSSHIPALVKRYKASNEGNSDSAGAATIQLKPQSTAAANLGKGLHIVSVDPDGIDYNGHFIAYNKRLLDACAEINIDFSVLGNVNLDFECLPKNMVAYRNLSVNSWELSLVRSGLRAPKTRTFQNEVESFLADFDLSQTKKLRFYMYCGSLEHAYAISRAISKYDNVDAHINLFWQSFISYESAQYINRWRPVVMELARNAKIFLTAPTSKVQKEVEKYFGLKVDVAPHPSATFSDEAARRIAESSLHDLKQPVNVVFPGAVRLEKGFALAVEVAELLQPHDGYDVCVRARVSGRVGEPIPSLMKRLAESGARMESEDLDDSQFVEFLEAGDIIVCPYSKQAFAGRTSGLVIDSMLLGRPVVALQETWLGDLIEQSGIGCAVAPTSEAILDGIREIANNYNFYARNIEKARKEYLVSNSWRALVKSITDDELSPREPPARDIAALKTKRNELIKTLPPNVRAPIFIPTDRVPLHKQIPGMEGVKSLYNFDLDNVYRPKLRALKYSRTKNRCFVIGNGPSLKHTELELLKNEVTFATNGFFLKLPELNWMPTFYVVEDHLVAEDRAHEINMLRGPTKLFPANIRYVLTPDDDTIYFDHRPRKRAPENFDFSFDADVHTYAGGTVTFTCLQLASYLGFEEIYLIGVDADYAVPTDAVLSGDGRVKEIDMKSDDPNHFHPDYFGKGKRWHEPNVDVMLKAYEEAKARCDERGVKIKNATVGGKLEIFDRVAFSSLFPKQPPRLLLIDLTRLNDGTATGELKGALFTGWPSCRLFQIYLDKGETLSTLVKGDKKIYSQNGEEAVAQIKRRVSDFSPDIILYRPTPNANALHELALELIAGFNAPLVTWIMDDWPAALAQNDPFTFKKLDNDWQALLRQSALRLSISDAMSAAFNDRYGLSFTAIANGVSEIDWPERKKAEQICAPFRLRYAGSLQENMTFSSVQMIAQAVEELSGEGFDITFEISTRQAWVDLAKPKFKDFRSTSAALSNRTPSQYREWLSEADAVVIAYNFDKESQAYVSYSIANKLPECLASGAPLLAVAPSASATMKRLTELNCGIRVTDNDVLTVKSALRDLITSPALRDELGEAGRRAAFTHFNITKGRKLMRDLLSEISDTAIREYRRDAHVHVDETQVVARLLSERRGREHVMIDVGAHFGTSAGFFDALGWTIHCFEPDPSNRSKLSARFGDKENVSIDTRAVSDKAGETLPFYTSPESTGISGLNKFRDTHKVTKRVTSTTIAEIVLEKSIQKIDFLKIDVEGFDFSVLKGVPWELLKPDVIECEYEDAKTVPLGHTWQDIADYLIEKGYTVYISEWHPIARYGIPHDWRRVVRYPGANVPSESWGNILAFRKDPGMESVQNAFSALTKMRANDLADRKSMNKARNDSASSTAQPNSINLPAQRPFYAEIGEKIAKRSPRLFAMLQFARRAIAGAWRRRLLTIPAAGLCVALFVLGLATPSAETRVLLWGAALVTLFGFALFYISMRVYFSVTGILAAISDLRKDLANARNIAKEAKKHQAVMQANIAKASSQLNALDMRLETTQGRLEKLPGEFRNAVSSLRNEIGDLKKSSDERLASFEKDSAAFKESVGKRIAELNRTAQTVPLLRERVVASEQQIGRLLFGDAPQCVVLFGHHKCGSRFFRFEVFQRIAEINDARIRSYKIVEPPFHYSEMDDLDICNIDFSEFNEAGREVVLFANATERSLDKINRTAADWKGLRVLRDPRQVLVSNYFHHKGDHHTEFNGWVWDKLIEDQPILRQLSKEDGLLYELDNISKGVIEKQLLAPFDDERILTIKLEAFSEAPRNHLREIATFLKAPEIAGLNFSKTGKNTDSGNWRNHFTSKLRSVFKDRYGQALIDLGYEEDLDW